MKQFNFLAMAIFAMIMSIGFVACSSDDDDNNGGGSITSGKKLVRISSEYETINFTYGEDGKLTRASRNVNGNSEYINLDWSGNTITLTTHARWEENPCTITLDNGKISKATDGEETYKAAYSGNYLSQITGYNINKYTWENGNIVNSVNYPSLDMGVCTQAGRVAIFHKNIANMITKFAACFGERYRFLFAGRFGGGCTVLSACRRHHRRAAHEGDEHRGRVVRSR